MKQQKSVRIILITAPILLVLLSGSYITAAYYGSNTASAVNGLALLLAGSVFALKKLKKSSLDADDLEVIQTRLKRL